MNDESEDWRWADADGVQNVVDEWELVSSLSSGSLPHYTLVWKVGWSTWLPACQVAELASAIPPDKAEKPVEPKIDASRKEPPAPPVEKYSAYQARDAASKLLGRSKSPTRPPPPPGSTAPGVGPGRGLPPPPAPRPRTPMPTLIDQPTTPATATLRPPGAVPPPPRAVPTQTAARDAPAATAIPTPLPMVPLTSPRFLREEAVELSPDELKSAPAHEPLTMPVATPGPIQVHEKPRILMPEPSELPTSPHHPPVQPVFERVGPSRSPTAFWLLGAVGVLGIVAMMLVAVVLIVKQRDEPTPIPSAPTASGTPSEASVRPCTLATKAKKIAPQIHHGIPPYVSADPESGRAAVGFAISDKEAIGLTIDLDTLATERKFSEPSREPITGVVPLTASGKLRFVVDRESSGLRFARSIDSKPAMTIGVSDEGFASIVGGGVPRTVWPGGEERRITEPRVARAGDGFVVTFRRGGQTGEVVAGWLGADGSRKSDLSAVQTTRKFIGTPVLGANDKEVLVAFAARPSENAYWSLQVATGALGEVPRRARPFSIPPGGLGAEAISPAVAGLSGGRWLLQWTEGSTGDRQVRLQTLGGDLIALGDPVTLSPEEVNAGQGVVWVRGEKALSLFLVKVTSGHELWGALLKCP